MEKKKEEKRAPVRIGLIGCGKITERLALPQLRGRSDVVVAALVDRDRSIAQRLADQFEIDQRLIWTDWTCMLKEADLEAVGVCVPNYLHAEITVAALNAKKHVLVEKPIAMTLAEADAMIEAARTNERYLMVDQTQRFDPVHEVAYEILRSDLLGRVTQLHGRIGHAGPEYWCGSETSWFLDTRQSGGGALMDVGIHVLDLLRWLSGKQVRRVCCQGKTLQERTAPEDTANALLEFTDGALGSFEVSWATRPYEVTTTFAADRGKLQTSSGSVNAVTIQLGRCGVDSGALLGACAPPVPAGSRYGGAYPYFIDCLLHKTPPCVSGEEGRASLEVILAAYESIRRNEWVELPQKTVHSR